MKGEGDDRALFNYGERSHQLLISILHNRDVLAILEAKQRQQGAFETLELTVIS